MAQQSTDTALLEALRSGSAGAYRGLYVRHYNMIRHLVLQNSGREEDAGDLLQEGAMALFEIVKKPGFQLTAALSTFFYSVCRNLWLKQLRAKKKARFVDFEEVVEIPAVDEAEDLSERQNMILQQCLKKLGESCQKLLEHYYFFKQSMTEIAEEMGYNNTDTVKTRKYKCMQQLKKLALAAAAE